MSHPARAPRSGIDGKANAAGGRHSGGGCVACGPEAARIGWGMRVRLRGFDLADGSGVGPAGRTGRVRSRTKVGPEEKIKKPAEGVRKKSPPARKAPSRGRYVDEYARPVC